MRAKALNRWRRIFADLPSSPTAWRESQAVLKRHVIEVEADHSPSNMLNSLMIPILPDVAAAIGVRLTRERLAKTALRLVERRVDSGSLPTDLTNLGSEAIDPFSGKPFLFVRRTRGFKLYSVGGNGRDDGGVKGEKTTDGDLVVEVKFR
jgi:hypothetical protein